MIDYDFYVFTKMANTEDYDTYSDEFDDLTKEYETFLASSYNNDDESFIDCINNWAKRNDDAPLHPLLTEGKNKHYDNSGKSTIGYMESKIAVLEMIGFCKANILKYELREKGSNAEDGEKRGKYIDYLNVLNKLPVSCSYLKVNTAWNVTGQQWRYC